MNNRLIDQRGSPTKLAEYLLAQVTVPEGTPCKCGCGVLSTAPSGLTYHASPKRRTAHKQYACSAGHLLEMRLRA